MQNIQSLIKELRDNTFIMSRHFSYKVNLFLLLLLLLSPVAFAGKEKVSNRLYGTEIIVGHGKLALADALFPDITSGCRVKGSDALITFGIDHSNIKVNSTEVYAVTFTVTYFDIAGVSHTTAPYTLDVNSSAGKDKDIVHIPGAYHVSVNISDVSHTLPDNIFLEAEIETERYYNFDMAVVPFALGGLSGNFISDSKELHIMWQHLSGAEEYELEYTYVDDYSMVSLANQIAAADLSYDFTYNSTRIRLSEEHYKIPVTYDRGYILYRVRGIGRGGIDLDKDLFGKWSSEATTNGPTVAEYAHKYQISVNQNYNYQASAAFAEGGKRKDVVSYFDGSLRMRQGVTKANSADKIIIGETIYDYEGRGVINVLPVPVVKATEKQTLDYHENFNLNSTGVSYSKADFDAGLCETTTSPMGTTNGAGLYYSQDNPEKSGENAYLPNAEGYPFTQVEFEPDNTGRIRRQSGLGATHKMSDDETGKETKYFYGQPEQEQLDRLFGNDVGFAGHYKKNMVIDANGQVSVSYHDLTGKVVATALAGKPLTNLESIESDAATMVTVAPIQHCSSGVDCNKNNTWTDNALVFTKQLLVASEGVYTFNYQVTPEEIKYPCYSSTTQSVSELCYDCIYELDISITDKCGNPVLKENYLHEKDYIEFITKKPIGTLAELTSCENRLPENISIACHLPVGVYTVTKKLTINQAAIDAYIDDRLKNCLKTIDDFKAEEKSKVDIYAACEEVTCKTCLLSLYYTEGASLDENYSSYLTNIESPLSKEEYQVAVDGCKELCEPTNACDASKGMMLSDVSPGGQYAVFDQNSEHWSLSLFNPANFLPENRNGGLGKPSWRIPVGDYKEADGTVSYILLTPLVDEPATETDFEPALNSANFVIGRLDDYNRFIPDPAGDLYGAQPEFLASEVVFRTNWKASWAEALLLYHPEYCYFESCQANDTKITISGYTYSSNDFDDRIQILQSFYDASEIQLEYIDDGVPNPLYDPKFGFALLVTTETDVNDLLDRDPYFAGSAKTALKNEMAVRLSNYHSLNGQNLNAKQFAAFTARCGNIYYTSGMTLSECTTFGTYVTGFTVEENNAIMDQEWDLYRSIYLSEKQKIQQKQADNHCMNSSTYPGYNGCVGNDQFRPFSPKFITWTSSNGVWSRIFGFRRTYSAISTEIHQPCGWQTYRLYANKVRRFTSEEDLKPHLNICDAGDSDLQGAFNHAREKGNLDHFLSTGQCPLARDFEGFLDEITSRGNLYSDAPSLRNFLSVTKPLYDYIRFGNTAGEDPGLFPYLDLSWVMNLTSTVPDYERHYSVSNGTTAVICTLSVNGGQEYRFVDENENKEYRIILSFDQIPAYEVRTYGSNDAFTAVTNGVRFSLNFIGVRNLYVTNTVHNHFILEGRVQIIDNADSNNPVVIETINNLAMGGSVAMPLAGCDFTRVCELSDEVKDLQELLSGIAAKQEFNKSGVLLTDKDEAGGDYYDPLFTSLLRFYSSNDAGTTYSFSSTITESNLSGTIFQGTTAGLNISLTTTSAIDFSHILSFSCIQADNSTPDNLSDFIVTAITDPNGNGTLVYVDFTGSVSSTNTNRPFRIEQCGPPAPETCKGFEYDNLRHMKKFLSELVGGGGKIQSNNLLVVGGTRDLTASLPFIEHFQPQLLGGKTFVVTGITGNIVQASIYEGTISLCDFTLDLSALPEGITTSSVTDFVNIQPDYEMVDQGKTYHFKGSAVYYDGVSGMYHTISVKGASCFSLALCDITCLAREENLVRNGDFSDPENPAYKDVGWKTDYTVQLGGDMAAGQIRIVKDANNAHSSFWFGKDYPSEDGYLLAIDGVNHDRIWYTEVDVKPNVQYEFTAFVRNVFKESGSGELPNIDLYINEGAGRIVIASVDQITYNAGWVRLEGAYTAQVDQVIEIGVVARDALSMGHDIGLDYISFTRLCPADNPILPTFAVSEENSCLEHLSSIVDLNAENNYNRYIANQRNKFRQDYLAQCQTVQEKLNYTYPEREFHYTLYYYDQAGNLVKTLPPAGVVPLGQDKLDAIREDRLNNNYELNIQPEHFMPTTYAYNSLNQLVNQALPDHVPMNVWETAEASGSIPDSYEVKSMEFSDASNGWAIAVDENDPLRRGRLLTTANGGANWNEISKVGITDLKAVQIVSATVAYAVGSDGTLLKSVDGGVSWVNMPIGMSVSPVALYFDPAAPDAGRVFASDGNIYKTFDGGMTWTNPGTGLSAIIKGNLQDIHVNAGTYTAVSHDGANGYVFTSSDGDSWTSAGPVKGLSYASIEMTSAIEGYVAGDYGNLIKTTDGGSSWKSIPTDLSLNIRKIHFRNALDASALLENGEIWRSSDGGKTWQITDVPAGEVIVDFHFVNASTGFAIASNATYYRSGNGGLSWDYYGRVSTTDTYTFISFSDNANGASGGNAGKLLMLTYTSNSLSFKTVVTSLTDDIKDGHFKSETVGCIITGGSNGGKILKTEDATATTPVWTDVTPASVGAVEGWDFIDLNTGFAYTSTGTVLKTIDGGISWSSLAFSPAVTGIKDIFFTDANHGFVAGLDGKIYRTADGGNSAWIEQSGINPAPLNGAYTESASVSYLVGQDGTLIKKDAAGSQMQSISTNTTLNDFHSGMAVGDDGLTIAANGSYWTVSSLSGALAGTDLTAVTEAATGVYYATGKGGKILKNSAGSWTEEVSGTAHDLCELAFNGSTLGLAVGKSGSIVRYNGTSWTNVSQIASLELNASCRVPGTNTGYVVGNGGTIMKTTDGGKTWTSQNSGTTLNLNGIYFLDALTGAAVGNGGKVLRTTDGGSTWTAVTSGASAHLHDVHLSGNKGVIAGEGGTILRTTDAGASWLSETSSTLTSAVLKSVFMTDENTAYIAGAAGTMVKSINGGDSWVGLKKSGTENWTDAALNEIYFTDALTGYAVGSGGTILKTLNKGETWMLQSSGVASNVELSGITQMGEGAIFSGSAGTVRSLADMADRISGRFWYDELGRLVIFQNSKQFAESPVKAYSYTIYDALGRIKEVGEIHHGTTPGTGDQIPYEGFNTWLSGGSKSQITRSYYDKSIVTIDGFSQDNLRTRVSSVTYQDSDGSAYQYASHYSYDIHGNVKSLIQENQALAHLDQAFKRIDYSYDLASGNVKEVHYQKGQIDQFLHRYEYDADNRIVQVETSTDGFIWDRDANYFYYQHGPLARMELGELQVQGVDYAYTIQGWIKGVNTSTLNAMRDVGKDGAGSSLHRNFAKDEFGYSLGYFNGDYQAINSAGEQHFLADPSESALNAANTDLYNGNISHMVTAIGELSSGWAKANLYRYDQLNRLKTVNTFKDDNVDVTNKWTTQQAIPDYSEQFVYDDNGNITFVKRNASETAMNSEGTGMDNLEYIYENKERGYERQTNKLRQVIDRTQDSPVGDDFESGQQANNYEYDAIGNLTKDEQEHIAEITWTVYGKIKSVVRDNIGTHSLPDLEFAYDASGNRIMKLVKPRSAGVLLGEDQWEYTYYVRDASGNVMSTYKRAYIAATDNYTDQLTVRGNSIYGSSRLGVRNGKGDLTAKRSFTASLDAGRFTGVTYTSEAEVSAFSAGRLNRILGLKNYELSNHLGNVLVTVSDKVIVEPSVNVVNDNFDDGTVQGWVGDNATISNNAGKLKIVSSEPGSGTGKLITTIPGNTYNASVYIEPLTGGNLAVKISDGSSAPEVYQIEEISSAGTYTFSFTAKTATTKVAVVMNEAIATNTEYQIDNVIITNTPYVLADVTSAQDYYAFGAIISDRSISIGNYRYGFNGQEKDDEIAGGGNSYSAEYWQYDSRLGRRWNVDPVVKEHESPYACFANNPIWFIDPLGADSAKWSGNDDYWIMEKGDNLWALEEQWGVEHGTLYELNKDYFGWESMDDAKNIQIGDWMLLPKGMGGEFRPDEGEDVGDRIGHLVEYSMKTVNTAVGGVSTYTVYSGNYYKWNEVWHQTKTKGTAYRWQSRWNRGASKFHRANQIKSVAGARKLNSKLTKVGAVLIGADIALSGELKPSHAINGFMLGISTTGVGGIVAGVWFIADFGTMGVNYVISGEPVGISDMIDESIGTYEMYEGVY